MLESGTLLQDRYRIVRTLGEGGMATVYLAQDLAQGSLVAVKVLHPREGRFAPGTVHQFRAEVAMLRALRHPNLPCLFDFLELEQCHCLVMEYVAGQTLDRVLRAEAPLAEGRVLGWTRQLCEALHYLHSRQPPVIFRDLKPSNVMLGEGEQVKLIDFGIAKLLDANLKGRTQTTARGMLSRGFAAVEQYVGGTDPRSDVYSLGATLYNLLSGQQPPESMAVATGRAAAADVRAERPDLSERTASAIQAMMQVDRNLRPQTVRAVWEALGFGEAELADVAPGAVLTPPPQPRTEAPPSSDDPPTERWNGATEE